MCTPNHLWDQLSLFPERNTTGSGGNAGGPCMTSEPDAPETQTDTRQMATFELTCRCSDVTLTKRLTLELSAWNQDLNRGIYAIFAAELLMEAEALAESTCAKP